MSTFSFRIPVGASDLFADLPKGAKRFLGEGLSLIGRIHTQYGQLIASVITESAYSGVEPKLSDLAKTFQLNESDSQALLGAISFIVLILSKPGDPEPISKVVNSLVSSEILDRAASPAIESVLNAVDENRAAVSAGFRRSHLATRLLASFTDLGTVVDVRLDFDNDQIAVAVPVLLVHIDTDVDEEEMRFQMTRKQLEETIEDFKKALTRIEAAEKWIRGR